MNPLTKLAAENETAFYVFDIKKLKERVARLKSALPQDVDLCYAVKANTFIIKELIGSVERFEVCSPGEASICAALGVPEEKTVISGVYKTPDVIETMVASSSKRIFTVESLVQFELLDSLSKKYNKVLKVLLRLTNDSQFGINAGEIEDIVKNRGEYKSLDILGLQFFSGTQKASFKKLRREIAHLDELLLKLQSEYGFVSRELEYGPGFPVAYFEGEDFGEEELIAQFSDALSSMQFKAKISLELGRSIAACCGSYCAHVVDIKRNKGQNYILIDGGMHHLVYFGQHMAMKHPLLFVPGKETEEKEEAWNICGSLCSMNDIVAKQVMLPRVKLGDVICFENTGAYCMTEGISLFLSREIPAVYLKKENGDFLCVRKKFETSVLNTPKY